MSLLKRNKAPGIDSISPELLKDGGNSIRYWLLRIRRLGERASYYIPQPKKGACPLHLLL